MNIADGVVVVILAVATVWGWHRSAIAQASGFIGVITGFMLSALLYEKVAFLTQSSAVRTIVLVAVLAGTIFLCTDLFVILARWLQDKYWPHSKPGRVNAIVASGLTAVGTLAVIILGAAAFTETLPGTAREQLRASAIIGTITSHVQLPAAVYNLASLREPFSEPVVFSGTETVFTATATAPISSSYADLDAAAARVQESVVKITVWGCGSVATGSGFVVDSRHVLTNAHVVAGSDRISLANGNRTLVGTVVWFDPRLDAALLYTQSDLDGAPLHLSTGIAQPGTIAAHLGATPDSGIETGDVVVLELVNATGYDIFRREQVSRQVYALRGDVIPGNSGGPVIDASGNVIGVTIGHSTTQNRTGYAIAATQVTDLIKKSPALVNVVLSLIHI